MRSAFVIKIAFKVSPFLSVMTESLFPSKHTCLDILKHTIYHTLAYLVMFPFLCLMITFIDFILLAYQISRE